MRAHFHPLAELTPSDLAAWRDLAAQALERNVFFEPDFLLPAARNLGTPSLGLVVARNGNGWAGCLPVHRTARWRKLPLPMLSSWRHAYCFLGTPLLDRDLAESALEGLMLEALRRSPTGTLVLEWLGDDGPVAAALAELVASRSWRSVRYERFERAALRRRDEHTYLEETLQGHRRRELQRLRRALARDVGEPAETRDRSGDAAAVDDFLRLEGSGWKGLGGTALASRAPDSQFFREVCAAFSAAGRLQLLELRAGDEAVALKCNLLAGDLGYCFKIAYDDRYARYSPGVQLERDMVDVFHERTELNAMDSCADPDNEMINRLWPDRRAITTIVVGTGLAGRAGAGLVSAATAVRNRVRR